MLKFPQTPKFDNPQRAVELLKLAKANLKGGSNPNKSYTYLCHALESVTSCSEYEPMQALILEALHPCDTLSSWADRQGIEAEPTVVYHMNYRLAWVDHMIKELEDAQIR